MRELKYDEYKLNWADEWRGLECLCGKGSIGIEADDDIAQCQHCGRKYKSVVTVYIDEGEVKSGDTK